LGWLLSIDCDVESRVSIESIDRQLPADAFRTLMILVHQLITETSLTPLVELLVKKTKD